MNKEEIEQEKQVEYYSNIVQAWINTRMELDKSILTLSSAAIGLLVTFKIKTPCEIFLYIISISAFLIAIISSLQIFRRNAEYLEEIVNNLTNKSDSKLETLDKRLVNAFKIGIIATVFLSLILIKNNQFKGYHMQEKNKTIILEDENINLSDINDLVISLESFNNITKLEPVDKTQDKSLNNIVKLKPDTNVTQSNIKDKNSSSK